MNNKSNDDFYVKWEKNDFKYSTERINALKEIIDRLSKLEPDNEFIKGLI